MMIRLLKKYRVIGFRRRKLYSFFLMQVVLNGHPMVYGRLPAGYQYISPLPNASHVSPHATILFRLRSEKPSQIINLNSCVIMQGSKSGRYTCRISTASDHQTVICRPDLPFSPGEKVTVNIRPQFEPEVKAGAKPIEFELTISNDLSRGAEKSEQKSAPAAFSSASGSNGSTSRVAAKIFPNGVSVPANFPEFKVTVAEEPFRGHLFLSTIEKNNWAIIFDPDGYPCWYLNTPYPRYDLKLQDNSWITMFVQKEEGRSFGSGFIALDHTLTEVDSFYADGGYETDYHELKLLDGGNYLLLGTREERVDLSGLFPGGNTDAIVRESAIQEFTATGEMIFLWRAWDHFDITDLEIENIYLPAIRFPHMNALDIDQDGHILLSSRHLSEITKINRQTGEIIWRLGGAHNQFTFINDPLAGFSGQHDVHALGNGRYLLFDNGNLHQPPVSRAVEYELDTDKMTATLVWQFRDTPDKYSSWMGNAQRLPNGNTLINWSRREFPKPTEVTPEGKKVFEMEFPDQINCYRIFRFDWQGEARKPYLMAEPYDDHVTLLFNKFGDRDIQYYKIYADERPQPTTVVDTSRQSQKTLFGLTNKRNYYFRVTAVDTAGGESPFSNEETVFVNSTMPEENMVLNADFSDGLDFWKVMVNDDSAQSSAGVNGEQQFHFAIAKGGSEFHHIQLSQGQMKLLKGQEYLFEFDARADSGRLIEAYVTDENDAGVNYGKIGPTWLSTGMKHFAYPFRPNLTDFKAVVIFNAGSSDADVFIDNVSLKQNSETDVGGLEERFDFRLQQNYPNPFNQETIIEYHLSKRSRVRLTVCNINGQLICPLVEKIQDAGHHRITWNGRNLENVPVCSGIYFCRLEMMSQEGNITGINKMTLLR
ncbi:MAG: T9SS C-terminal target domain-containing protein [Calditrichaeota bacterium]|nr:MAG: T9SS C-terminal target domain-containing protein [Calditrichota bacterium]